MSKKEIIKPRLEEDGLYISNPEHWELLENIKLRGTTAPQFTIHFPIDLIRHLGLQHGDLLDIAIRRSISRNNIKITLNPIDSSKIVYKLFSKSFVDKFLESDMDKVELPLQKYRAVLHFIRRNIEYQSKVKVHCRNCEKPNFYGWIEKIGSKTLGIGLYVYLKERKNLSDEALKNLEKNINEA